MSKSAKKAADQAEREKVHKRYSNRREPDVIYPAKKQVDFYDADIHQRVAVYVRVSTDNLGQETSYELQKNYYEEFVLKHPNWKLVKIYADKGISGTSTKHRVELNQMLADSRAGKIDLIITKSVSRLARNTVDCITMVRNLAELRNPVGVFFAERGYKHAAVFFGFHCGKRVPHSKPQYGSFACSAVERRTSSDTQAVGLFS